MTDLPPFEAPYEIIDSDGVPCLMKRGADSTWQFVCTLADLPTAVAEIVWNAVRQHQWYHDGFMAGGSSGRICTVCRYREGSTFVQEQPGCSGSRAAFEFAAARGRAAGWAAKGDDIRERLGL